MDYASSACDPLEGEQTKPANAFHSFGAFAFCPRTKAFGSGLERYSEEERITRLRLVILQRGNKQSPPTSFTRSALLLLVLAQIHLARSKKQKPTGKCRRALFVGDTGFEPVTSCLSSKRSKPTELITQNLGSK